ncbi:MAG: metallophosphoesterase [Bacilli bacterium]|nr:metallophosphoesterase [Bacilli bacterium]
MNKSKLGPLSFLTFLVTPFCFSCSGSECKPTRIAVFADNQLTSAVTSGATENAIPFLKSHFLFCKENNVDVVVISGDLVNNAVSSYYERANSILKEVYGEDENQYPEFVYSMGNHEWYTNDAYEKQSDQAIALFKKYGRIKSKCLKKEATFSVVGQTSKTGADFYKVINGIPFLSISGSDSGGMLSYPEETELKGWLKEISELPSVLNGGPIFVANHYAIKEVSYSFGQGAGPYSESIDELLKPYPQAFIFTGDTHYSGVNERTISQVDYTAINIGSSSYSRHVSRSALMGRGESYYNLKSGSGSKDTLIGEVAQGYNATPHIQLVDVDENGNVKINRYFSGGSKGSKRIGMEWSFPHSPKKDGFRYTNSRFGDGEWAKMLYGQNGLSWSKEAKAEWTLSSAELTVRFPDVVDFNCCERYRISVNEKPFDFVSHYYKYDDNAHLMHFSIDRSDLPAEEIFQIKVSAYDFFDNESLNCLLAERIVQ